MIILYLLILSMPFYGFSLLNIAGRGFLPLVWFFATLLIVVFFMRICLGKQKIKINIVGRAVVTFNLIAVLSLVHLVNAETSQLVDFFTKWIQVVLWSLLFFSISNLRIEEKHLINMLKIWLLTAFIVSLHLIYQSIAKNLGLNLPFVYINLTNPSLGVEGLAGEGTFGMYVRASSVFPEPSYLGSYLMAPILILGFELMHGKNSYHTFEKKGIKWIMFFTILCAFLLSFSIAAYITLATIILFILLDKKLRRKSLKIGLIILIVVGAGIWVIQNLGVDFFSAFSRVRGICTAIKLNQIAGSSFQQRWVCMLRGLKIGMDHLLFGVGLNNLHYYFASYTPPSWYVSEMGSGTGNVWLQVLGEMGIVGFLALASIWGVVVLKMRRYVKKNKDSRFQFVLAAFYYIVLAEVVNSLFTHSYVHIQRWLILSLAVMVMFFIDSHVREHRELGQTSQQRG